MCIKDGKAELDSGYKADLSLLKDLKAGDYVLVQQGFAVRKISKKEAKEIFEAIKN